MGFTIQQDQARVKATWRFQMNAELREIELLDCSAAIVETPGQPEGEFRLGLQLDPAILKVEQGSARFAVRMKIFADPKDAEVQPENHALEVACRFALGYALKPGYTPSQEELDAFKEANAVFHCWPFFRELVQNLTMRMRLEIPPLPLLRLVPKAAPKKQSAKRSSRTSKNAAADSHES